MEIQFYNTKVTITDEDLKNIESIDLTRDEYSEDVRIYMNGAMEKVGDNMRKSLSSFRGEF